MLFYILVGGVVVYIAVLYGVKHGIEASGLVKTDKPKQVLLTDDEIEKELQ